MNDDDKKRLDEAAARYFESKVSCLARQLFVAVYPVSDRGIDLPNLFDAAELFEAYAEARWKSLE